jgi:Uma2 family endonuclease
MVGMASALDTSWRRHAFTVDELERMVATGVLAADAHVELLEGDLVEMSPQGPEHAARHTGLRDRLIAAYAELGHVRDQCPLFAGPLSLPEPDLAVVLGPALDYIDAHPHGTDTLLVIEVAVSSQRLDRAKAITYACAGVPAYWVVDLVARTIEIHHEPTPDGYRHHRVLGPDEELELPGLDARWRVGSLL